MIPIIRFELQVGCHEGILIPIYPYPAEPVNAPIELSAVIPTFNIA